MGLLRSRYIYRYCRYHRLRPKGIGRCRLCRTSLRGYRGCSGRWVHFYDFMTIPRQWDSNGANILDSIGAVESVKAASDIYAPVSGIIESINETLADSPSLLNKKPQSDGTSILPSPPLHRFTQILFSLSLYLTSFSFISICLSWNPHQGPRW
jgi:hypothetical protein